MSIPLFISINNINNGTVFNCIGTVFITVIYKNKEKELIKVINKIIRFSIPFLNLISNDIALFIVLLNDWSSLNSWYKAFIEL